MKCDLLFPSFHQSAEQCTSNKVNFTVICELLFFIVCETQYAKDKNIIIYFIYFKKKYLQRVEGNV